MKKNKQLYVWYWEIGNALFTSESGPVKGKEEAEYYMVNNSPFISMLYYIGEF